MRQMAFFFQIFFAIIYSMVYNISTLKVYNTSSIPYNGLKYHKNTYKFNLFSCYVKKNFYLGVLTPTILEKIIEENNLQLDFDHQSYKSKFKFCNYHNDEIHLTREALHLGMRETFSQFIGQENTKKNTKKNNKQYSCSLCHLKIILNQWFKENGYGASFIHHIKINQNQNENFFMIYTVEPYINRKMPISDLYTGRTNKRLIAHLLGLDMNDYFKLSKKKILHVSSMLYENDWRIDLDFNDKTTPLQISLLLSGTERLKSTITPLIKSGDLDEQEDNNVEQKNIINISTFDISKNVINLYSILKRVSSKLNQMKLYYWFRKLYKTPKNEINKKTRLIICPFIGIDIIGLGLLNDIMILQPQVFGNNYNSSNNNTKFMSFIYNLYGKIKIIKNSLINNLLKSTDISKLIIKKKSLMIAHCSYETFNAFGRLGFFNFSLNHRLGRKIDINNSSKNLPKDINNSSTKQHSIDANMELIFGLPLIFSSIEAESDELYKSLFVNSCIFIYSNINKYNKKPKFLGRLATIYQTKLFKNPNILLQSVAGYRNETTNKKNRKNFFIEQLIQYKSENCQNNNWLKWRKYTQKYLISKIRQKYITDMVEEPFKFQSRLFATGRLGIIFSQKNIKNNNKNKLKYKFSNITKNIKRQLWINFGLPQLQGCFELSGRLYGENNKKYKNKIIQFFKSLDFSIDLCLNTNKTNICPSDKIMEKPENTEKLQKTSETQKAIYPPLISTSCDLCVFGNAIDNIYSTSKQVKLLLNDVCLSIDNMDYLLNSRLILSCAKELSFTPPFNKDTTTGVEINNSNNTKKSLSLAFFTNLFQKKILRVCMFNELQFDLALLKSLKKFHLRITAAGGISLCPLIKLKAAVDIFNSKKQSPLKQWFPRFSLEFFQY